MWSCRARDCFLKRSTTYLYWTCFSSFKASLLEMEPAAKAGFFRSFTQLINLQLIDKRFLSFICWRNCLYGRALEEFGRVLHFFSTKIEECPWFYTDFNYQMAISYLSSFKGNFQCSYVATRQYLISRYCLTASGQILHSDMPPLKWAVWIKDTPWQMKHDWFLFKVY